MMRKSVIFRYAWRYAIFILCMSLLVNAVSAGASLPSANITLSRQYSSHGIEPMVNEYVSYDLSIQNTSDNPLENQSLWVAFVSKGGVTSVQTAYSVPRISPGETAILHLGPFKMRESGEHELHLGMNRLANPSLQNDVLLDHDPTVPADRFEVKEAVTAQGLILTALFSSLGAVTIFTSVAYFMNKKKKQS